MLSLNNSAFLVCSCRLCGMGLLPVVCDIDLTDSLGKKNKPIGLLRKINTVTVKSK